MPENLARLHAPDRDFRAEIETATADGDAKALLRIGMHLDDLERFDEAMVAFERGTELGEPGCILLYGRGLEDRGDVDGAASAYRRGVQLDDQLCAYNLGLILMNQGVEQEALELFDRALDRGVGRAVFPLIQLLDAEADHARIVKALGKAVSRGEPAAAVYLGDELLRFGNEKSAIRAYRLGMQYGVPECFVQLASLQEEKGNLDDAIATLKRGAETCTIGNHFMQGRIHLIEGDSELAIAAFRKGLADNDGLSANNLGYLLWQKDELVLSAAALERAIELNVVEAAVNLALVRLEQGDHARAAEALEFAGQSGVVGPEIEEVRRIVDMALSGKGEGTR